VKGSAKARANIALAKYWGKLDSALNIPVVGSISITLDALWTETEVEFNNSYDADTLVLNGEVRKDLIEHATKFLDLLRIYAGVKTRAHIVSKNNFPTGAGLASSASGFAALAIASANALKLDLSQKNLSIIARQGSGSAARSIFGGFVEMHAGQNPDGSDSFAEPIIPSESWPLEVVIAITEKREKVISSRVGMTQSSLTSPYYLGWVKTSTKDLSAIREAIYARDFERLAEVSEHNCLKMHAVTMTSQPALIYWKPATVACIHAVKELRTSGVPVFFTIDAGPQLKAICAPDNSKKVQEVLQSIPGVLDTLVTGLGADAQKT
tara:strand:+ start:7634 stop:8605 length:972 start_codon:yes stop_codon:yes gene_type:complete